MAGRIHLHCWRSQGCAPGSAAATAATTSGRWGDLGDRLGTTGKAVADAGLTLTPTPGETLMPPQWRVPWHRVRIADGSDQAPGFVTPDQDWEIIRIGGRLRTASGQACVAAFTTPRSVSPALIDVVFRRLDGWLRPPARHRHHVHNAPPPGVGYTPVSTNDSHEPSAGMNASSSSSESSSRSREQRGPMRDVIAVGRCVAHRLSEAGRVVGHAMRRVAFRTN